MTLPNFPSPATTSATDVFNGVTLGGTPSARTFEFTLPMPYHLHIEHVFHQQAHNERTLEA